MQLALPNGERTALRELHQEPTAARQVASDKLGVRINANGHMHGVLFKTASHVCTYKEVVELRVGRQALE
jgi:hypothetical protein